MWPVGEIGTDPRMANNALGRDPATGRLTPRLTGRLQGYEKTIRRDEGVFAAEDRSLGIVGNAVEGTLLHDLQRTFEAIVIDRCNLTTAELKAAPPQSSPPGEAASNTPNLETILQILDECANKPELERLRIYQQAAQAQIGAADRKAVLSFLAGRLQAQAKGAMQGGGQHSSTTDPLAYKARPLDGIWATAPYLHNGSVPTLADLLKSPADRPEEFYVGSHEFDPTLVGFRTGPTGKDEFLFDTKHVGNGNAGHEYGTTLSDDDKKALLEYLRSL